MSEFAARYDALMGFSERAFLRPVRRALLARVRGRVLEIGAGTGANLPFYGATAGPLVATEPDPTMLAAWRRRAGPRASGVRARAEALPFRAGAFDAAVATFVLCSVPRVDRALAEIRRVLRPGGGLAVLEHVRYESAVGLAIQRLAAPLWRRFFGGCRPDCDTRDRLRAAGFDAAALRRRLLGPPVPPYLFVRPHVFGMMGAAP